MYNHSDQTGDRVLGFHWRVSRELVERLGLDPGGRDKAQRARRSIVAALALAAETDRPWVSYSRSKGWYAGGAHYPGCDYTYDTVVPAADDLIEAGLVIEQRGLVREGGSGIQSRMKASPLFIERLAGGLAVEHVTPRCPLIMRGEDGRMMPLPRTEAVHRMLKKVQAVNEGIRDIRVTVSPEADAADWQIGERHWRARKIHPNGLKTWADVLPTPSQYVIQILGRGRLDCHGRLYAWYLGLPKVRRAELLLDGAPVDEPDFEFLHPWMLYQMAGATLEGDPYITGVHHRDHNKLALNVGINADGGRTGAIRAIAAHDKWIKWGLSYEYAGQVYDQVTRRNRAIAPYLGSDAGVRLMGIDSKMCMQVLKGCRDAGIKALPVHDSFIVPATRSGEVKAIMEEVLHATRIGISAGTIKTSIKRHPQAPSASPSPAPLSSPTAKPKRVAAKSRKAPGKAVSSPVQTVEPTPALPVRPSSSAPQGPDWDLAERTEALTVHFEVKAKSSLSYIQHILGRGAATPGELRRSLSQAREEAVEMARREWDEGRRLVDRVPDRLSDGQKAKRARAAQPKAPRPRRPLHVPRNRRPSTRWAQPEAIPATAKAKPQATLF